MSPWNQRNTSLQNQTIHSFTLSRGSFTELELLSLAGVGNLHHGVQLDCVLSLVACAFSLLSFFLAGLIAWLCAQQWPVRDSAPPCSATNHIKRVNDHIRHGSRFLCWEWTYIYIYQQKTLQQFQKNKNKKNKKSRFTSWRGANLIFQLGFRLSLFDRLHFLRRLHL